MLRSWTFIRISASRHNNWGARQNKINKTQQGSLVENIDSLDTVSVPLSTLWLGLDHHSSQWGNKGACMIIKWASPPKQLLSHAIWCINFYLQMYLIGWVRFLALFLFFFFYPPLRPRSQFNQLSVMEFRKRSPDTGGMWTCCLMWTTYTGKK